MRTGPAVLHVTESYGGGVAAAIGDYCRNFPGAAHHLVYAPRADAPITASDFAGFASVTQLPESHLGRLRAIRKLVGAFDAVTIHAHSSYGGAYARLAVRKQPSRRIVYTPHCYAFERQDIPRLAQSLFWMSEWLLAFNTTLFAGCSDREVRLSKWPLTLSNTILLPNVFPLDVRGISHSVNRGPSLRVVGAGRLSPQKDPGYFEKCVLELRAAGLEVAARWIGGGDEKIELALKNAGIEVTGWLPRGEVHRHLAEADVYIHTGRWEGFPVAVLESSALGVATIIRDIPAFDDLPCELKVDAAMPLIAASYLDGHEAMAAWQADNVDRWRRELERNHDGHQAYALRLAYNA